MAFRERRAREERKIQPPTGHEKDRIDNEKYLREQKEPSSSGCVHSTTSSTWNSGQAPVHYHAARVLPGFDPNVKMRLCASSATAPTSSCASTPATSSAKGARRLRITYDADALKLIDDLREWASTLRGGHHPLRGPALGGHIQEEAGAAERSGVHPPLHARLPDRRGPGGKRPGYGANEYIETKSPLVVVTGPGPGSGKMATCLCRCITTTKGARAALAKFETFPIWSIPLKHPVNWPTRRPRPTSPITTSSTPSTRRPTARSPSTITATWNPSRCSGAYSRKSAARRPRTNRRPTWGSTARASA